MTALSPKGDVQSSQTLITNMAEIVWIIEPLLCIIHVVIATFQAIDSLSKISSYYIYFHQNFNNLGWGGLL